MYPQAAWPTHKALHNWKYCIRRGKVLVVCSLFTLTCSAAPRVSSGDIRCLGAMHGGDDILVLRQDRAKEMPPFRWTGELRPYRIGPTRTVGHTLRPAPLSPAPAYPFFYSPPSSMCQSTHSRARIADAQVPSDVVKPDYAADGTPYSEEESRQQRMGMPPPPPLFIYMYPLPALVSCQLPPCGYRASRHSRSKPHPPYRFGSAHQISEGDRRPPDRLSAGT